MDMREVWSVEQGQTYHPDEDVLKKLNTVNTVNASCFAHKGSYGPDLSPMPLDIHGQNVRNCPSLLDGMGVRPSISGISRSWPLPRPAFLTGATRRN